MSPNDFQPCVARIIRPLGIHEAGVFRFKHYAVDGGFAPFDAGRFAGGSVDEYLARTFEVVP